MEYGALLLFIGFLVVMTNAILLMQGENKRHAVFTSFCAGSLFTSWINEVLK